MLSGVCVCVCVHLALVESAGDVGDRRGVSVCRPAAHHPPRGELMMGSGWTEMVFLRESVMGKIWNVTFFVVGFAFLSVVLW